MKIKGRDIAGVVVFWIMGIWMLVLSCRDIEYIFTGKTEEINEMIAAGDEPEAGDIVSIKVQYALDWYAESTTMGKNGTKNSMHCYAVLDNGKIISIEVKKYSAQYERLEELIYYTNSYSQGETYISPTSVVLTGVVRKPSSKVAGYYKDGLQLMGVDLSSDAYMLSIDTTQKRSSYIVMFVFSIIIVFVTTSILVAACRMKIKKKAAQEETEPVKPKYDPIFNQAFYDLHRTDKLEDEAGGNDAVKNEIRKEKNDSKYTLASAGGVTDGDNTNEESDAFGNDSDGGESVVKQSKFSLKKD